MALPTELHALEKHCKAHNYAGFSKFDALNSPLIESLFGFAAFPRLVITQVVNRIPLPLRSILGVKKTRNPKGIGNFVKGYACLYELINKPEYLDQIRFLSDWILENNSMKRSEYRGNGLAWGYNFPWQSPGFFAPRYFPNCIVTVFCAEALLKAYEQTNDSKYLQGAVAAKDFILKDLPVLEETETIKCIGYVPAPLKWKVININAVAAGFLSKLAKATSDQKLFEQAKKMIQWVFEAANEDASWNYTAPKGQSGIGPDNYHTGGILDGIYDYMVCSGDERFKPLYLKALNFYEENFFTADYAPKWRVHKAYPLDVHGAAQAILTFTKASRFELKYLNTAQKIALWTKENLQDKKGFFYYQKRRFFTWKLELMRWNNSWMFWALSELNLAASNQQTKERAA